MRCSVLVAALAGCGHPLGDLVDIARFDELAGADDPWTDRPAEVDCPPAARSIEVDTEGIPSLEIDTGACNYLSLSQPLLLDVKEGDTVELRLFHDTLYALEPARAHSGVVIGDWVLWDREEPIPTTAVDWRPKLVAPRDFDAGVPVLLHLHNHGENTWNFYSLRTLEP